MVLGCRDVLLVQNMTDNTTAFKKYVLNVNSLLKTLPKIPRQGISFQSLITCRKHLCHCVLLPKTGQTSMNAKATLK